MKLTRLALLLAAVVAALSLTSLPTSAATVSNDKVEFGRTRVLSFKSSISDSGSCFWCLSVWVKWSNGTASLASFSDKHAKPTNAISSSRITPKASAGGVLLSASMSLGGPSIGASQGGGTCNAGTYDSQKSSVSVSLSGTWCKVSGQYVRDARISVVGATQYDGVKWSAFAAS